MFGIHSLLVAGLLATPLAILPALPSDNHSGPRHPSPVSSHRHTPKQNPIAAASFRRR